jgi:hypothetical protein
MCVKNVPVFVVQNLTKRLEYVACHAINFVKNEWNEVPK